MDGRRALSSSAVRALVTGSAGFIGARLVRRLAARGDEVAGIDRRARRGAPGLHITMDLAERRNLGEIARWAGWADAVFHLAARPGVRSGLPDIDVRRRRDILTAAEHLLAVTPARTQLILASSSSVYGEAARRRGGWRPSREGDPLRPVSRYGRCKAEMEATARRYRRDGLAVARPFTVIGPGQRSDMALSIWIEAVRRSEPITVFGGLDRARDVTGVEAVVSGLTAMADLGFCGTVNLGAGRPRLLGEMIEAVFSAMGKETEVKVVPAHPEEVKATCADPSLAASQLGVDLATDLRRTAARQAEAQLGLPAPAR